MTKPRLSIRQIQGVTMAEFLDKEIYIFDELSVHEIGESLFATVLEHSSIKLLLSFLNVDYFSSALLGTLIILSKKVAENGGTFKLCSINPSIYQMFVLTKLDQIFEIYEDEKKALQSFSK